MDLMGFNDEVDEGCKPTYQESQLQSWMMNSPLIDDSPKTPTKSPCFPDKISPATTLKVAQKIPNLQNTILNIEFLHDSNSNECTRK